MEEKDILKIVTAHVFGTLFYGSSVWINELAKSTHRRILNSVQHSEARLTIGEYRNKLPRLTVDRISKRYNPHQWMSNSNAKMALSP